LRGSAFLVLLGCIAIALAALAGMMAYSESGPYLLRSGSLARRVVLMSSVPTNGTAVSLFESNFARTVELDVCLSTLRDLVVQRSADAGPVTRGCLAIAEATVARSPLDSNAWFIAATLAARLNDFAAAQRYLAESFRTGPSEQWIAERRALFAYALRDHFSALEREIDGDLALLLRTQRGLKVLAERYVTDSGLRSHLVEIAETLDRETQRRFFEHVREKVDRQG
jgi:hypothetical protein